MIRLLWAVFMFVTLMMVCWPESALALQPGDVVEAGAPILDQGSAGFVSDHGPASPAVTWDDVRNRWVMVFEFQLNGAADPTCRRGEWGLGVAVSYDPEGDSGWTVIDGDPSAQGISPLYEPPVDGSYKSCVVAHPAVFWTHATRRRTLGFMFKAESGTDSCAPNSDPNLCVYTGIGTGTVQFDAAGNVNTVTTSSTPRIDIARQFPDMGYGFESPIYLSGSRLFYTLVTVGTELYATTATNPLVNWSPLVPVLSPGSDSWNEDELFGQELVCGANGGLLSFQGGRTFTHQAPNPNGISEAGWSLMTSTNGGASWALDPNPIVIWFDDYDWRHWSVVRVGADAYRFWFTKKDPATSRLSTWYADANTNGAVGTPIGSICP